MSQTTTSTVVTKTYASLGIGTLVVETITLDVSFSKFGVYPPTSVPDRSYWRTPISENLSDTVRTNGRLQKVNNVKSITRKTVLTLDNFYQDASAAIIYPSGHPTNVTFSRMALGYSKLVLTVNGSVHDRYVPTDSSFNTEIARFYSFPIVGAQVVDPSISLVGKYPVSPPSYVEVQEFPFYSAYSAGTLQDPTTIIYGGGLFQKNGIKYTEDRVYLNSYYALAAPNDLVVLSREESLIPPFFVYLAQTMIKESDNIGAPVMRLMLSYFDCEGVQIGVETAIATITMLPMASYIYGVADPNNEYYYGVASDTPIQPFLTSKPASARVVKVRVEGVNYTIQFIILHSTNTYGPIQFKFKKIVDPRSVGLPFFAVDEGGYEPGFVINPNP